MCLEDAAGEPVIRNVTLQANQDTETFRSKRFTMSFGTGEAVMRVDGKPYPVSDDAPIGYEIRAGGKPQGAPGGRAPDLRMTVRAGIVVTGTEVLSGIIADRNGPWLSERLRERGVELAHIMVVGRPARRRAGGARLPRARAGRP